MQLTWIGNKHFLPLNLSPCLLPTIKWGKKERKAICSKITTTKLEQVGGPHHNWVYSQKFECVSAGAGHELV